MIELPIRPLYSRAPSTWVRVLESTSSCEGRP